MKILFGINKKQLFIIWFLIACYFSSNAQVINLPCQTETDATIGLDRKNFPGTPAISSEGYLHNFDLPDALTNPCKRISQISISYTINSITSNQPADCTTFDWFINLVTGCPSTAAASCPDAQYFDVVQGTPITTTTNYFSPPENFNLDEVLSIDLIPAQANIGCTDGQAQVSLGYITMDYEICVSVTLVDELISTPVDLGMDQTVCNPDLATIDAGSYAQYMWSPGGQTTQMITVGDGTYEVTVTDANGCTDTDEIIITENDPMVTISSDDADDMICSDGMTMLTANTTVPNISWSTLETTPTIMVGPGMYGVTVTDAANCTATDMITIGSIPPPPIAFSPSPAAACGTGTVEVTATTGYAMYEWSTLQMGNPIDLPVGNYTLTVTDNDGCTNSAMLNVSLEVPADAGDDNAINVCNDNTTYDIEALLGVHDAGGNWTDVNSSSIDLNINASSVNFFGLTPSVYTYTYTVIGTPPCPDDVATISVTVNNAPFGGMSATESICNPTGTYNFNNLLSNPDNTGFWSDLSGSAAVIGNGSMVDLSALSPDTYVYNYQIPAGGGCMATSETLTIIISPPSNAGTGNSAALCEGSGLDLTTLLSTDADLTGTFTELSGTSTLTGSMINTTGQAGVTLMYQYEVGSATDPCGISTAIFNVSVVSSVSAGDDIMTQDCLEGSINLIDYISNADIGGNFEEVSSSGALTGSTFDVDAAGPGIYTFLYIVGDGLTCPLDSADIEIEIFDIPTYEIVTASSLCTDQCEELIINLTGTPGFIYSLDVYDDMGAITDLALRNTQMTSDTLYVCNNGGNGTFLNDTLSLNEVSAPYGLLITALSDDNCDLDLSSSTDTLFIELGAGSIFEFDSTICMSDTIEVAGDQYYFGNSMRMDTLTGISCDSIINININFYQEDSLIIEQTLCASDSLIIEGTTYNASNPIDTLDLTNVNGCDSTVFINLSFFPISELTIDDMLCTGQFIMVNGNTYDELNPSGVEVLMGQSSNGCDSTVTIDLSFGGSAAILRDELLCPDESIIVNGNTYDINNATGMETLTGGMCDTIVTIDLSFVTNLDGTVDGLFCSDFFTEVNGVRYDINNANGTETITNGSVAGCDSTVMIDLQFYPAANAMINDVLCEGDSIIVNGTTYNLSNDNGTETLIGMSVNGCDSTIMIDLSFNTTYDINVSQQICDGDSIFLENAWQMMAGTYTDNLMSTEGCDSIITTVLMVDMCNDAVVVMEGDNLCGGASTGVISIDLNDGVLPITIEWTGLSTGIANTTTATTLGNTMITDLPSDTYQLVITDAMGLVLYSQSVLVEDLNPIFDVSLSITTDILCADDLGTIEAIPTGGSPAYSYLWSDAAIGNNAIATDLISGSYSVTATDSNNCTDSNSISLTAPDPLVFDLVLIDPDCSDANSGSITVENITNGAAPFDISVNGTSITGLTQDGLAAGNYAVVVQDMNGCSATIDTSLMMPNMDSFLDYIDSYTIVQGDSVALVITPDDISTSFVWQDNPALSCIDCNAPVASPSTTQTFTGIAVNAEGCEEAFSITVNVTIPDVNIYVPNAFSPNNDGANDELEIFSSLGDNIVALNIKIYDRWGNQVHAFAGAADNYSWNGQFKNEPLMNGVYVYTLELVDINGEVYAQQGEITLIR